MSATQIFTLGVSLAAGLLAAALTQWWAGHHENVRWEREQKDRNVRWQREQQDRDVRWQREQQDRDVQWQRERKDRREEDRRQQYANLIAILDYWQSALDSLRENFLYDVDTGGDPDPEIGPRDMAELWRQRDVARQAMAIVDLVAPPKVRSLGHRAVEAGEKLSFNVWGSQAETVASDFRDSRTALSEAMREDLGLQATAEVAGN
jgi:hypothetical protein